MSQLAQRYASALYDVTKQKNNTSETMEVLQALRHSLNDNKQILNMLSTPLMTDKEKETVLKSAVGNQMNDEMATFFSLLTKNGRLDQIPLIAKAFEERVAKDMGVESGTVRSAIELTEQEKSEVKALIESKLAKKVDLTFTIDKAMIGGIEAKVGSYIFEHSIKTHMQKLNDFITRRVQ
jgi:F-type H+-transporting ATPase subunit delta